MIAQLKLPSMVPAEGGRLVLRRTNEGVVALGVLHLPSSVRPDARSASRARTCVITAQATGPELMIAEHSDGEPQIEVGEGYLHDDLFAWAKQCAWGGYSGAVSSFFDARFVSAFPEHNSWTVLAIVPRLDIFGRDSTHQWIDIDEGGRLHKISSPVAHPLEGMGLRQIVRELCVWPDRCGGLHTLPTVTPEAAQRGSLARLFSVLLWNRMISAEGFEVACKNIPLLRESVAEVERRNPEYQRFLGAMAHAGWLRPEAAEPCETVAERDRLATQVCGSLVAEQRLREMAELEAALAGTTDEGLGDVAPTPR